MAEVSIVMAVKDRLRQLYRTLHSYEKLSYKDYELIIVDDGSKQDVNKVLELYDNLPITYLRIESGRDRPPNNAWNYGYKSTSGKFIIFTGGDILLSGSDLIERYLSSYAGYRISVLTYMLDSMMTNMLDMIDWYNNPDSIQQLPGFWTNRIGLEPNSTRLLAGLTTYMTGLPRDQWEWFGLFRNETTHLMADQDVVLRDIAMGRRVDTLPDYVVYHQFHIPPAVEIADGYVYKNDLQARLIEPAERDK